jgi:hypothetical protein
MTDRGASYLESIRHHAVGPPGYPEAVRGGESVPEVVNDCITTSAP